MHFLKPLFISKWNQHVVLVLLGILRYVIPDKPINLNTQLSRERQLAKEDRYAFERDKRRKSTLGNPLELLDTMKETELRHRVIKIKTYEYISVKINAFVRGIWV